MEGEEGERKKRGWKEGGSKKEGGRSIDQLRTK